MTQMRPLKSVYDQYVATFAGKTSTADDYILKDTGLIDDNSLKQYDVDIIFTKSKDIDKRKMSFEAFKKAIALIAARKGVSSQQLNQHLIENAAGGPSLSGTLPIENRFYDDRSLYTGVWRKGGPTVVDLDRQDFSRLLNRTPANIRGVKQEQLEAFGRPTLAGKYPHPDEVVSDRSSRRPQSAERTTRVSRDSITESHYQGSSTAGSRPTSRIRQRSEVATSSVNGQHQSYHTWQDDDYRHSMPPPPPPPIDAQYPHRRFEYGYRDARVTDQFTRDRGFTDAEHESSAAALQYSHSFEEDRQLDAKDWLHPQASPNRESFQPWMASQPVKERDPDIHYGDNYGEDPSRSPRYTSSYSRLPTQSSGERQQSRPMTPSASGRPSSRMHSTAATHYSTDGSGANGHDNDYSYSSEYMRSTHGAPTASGSIESDPVYMRGLGTVHSRVPDRVKEGRRDSSRDDEHFEERHASYRYDGNESSSYQDMRFGSHGETSRSTGEYPRSYNNGSDAVPTPSRGNLSGKLAISRRYQETDGRHEDYDRSHVDLDEAVHKTFEAYTHATNEEMESAKFIKLCRDADLIDATFAVTDADLIFQRAKKGGNYGKRMTYREFRLAAIPMIAERKLQSVEEVLQIIAASTGPKMTHPTAPSYVRLHDDKTTYTGVHGAGGPNVVETDVRGVALPPSRRKQFY